MNSAALLLRSANDRHPNGLANSSDVVGRHYMRHNNLALMAVSKEPNPTRFQKTLAHQRLVPRVADDWDYPLGGIQMLGKSDAEQIRANAPRWAGKVSPGDAVRGAGPPRRRLLAVRRGPAAAGEPGHAGAGRQIRLALDENNNVEGVKRLMHKLEGMLGDLGMHQHRLLDHSIYMHKGMPIGATAHQAGTVRFGARPGELGAGRQLQGPRPGQPLRRGHQLLPEHRRGEPVPDGDRQRPARRRPPHRPARAEPHRGGEPEAGTVVRHRRAGERGWQPSRWTRWSSSARPATWRSWRPSRPWSGWSTAGVLDVPVVGVAKSGWGLDQFRDYAAASLRLNGMDPDSPAATKMLGLLRYVDGDLDDDATYAAMSDEIGDGQARRCSTWRCRRRCSGGSPRASPPAAGPTARG